MCIGGVGRGGGGGGQREGEGEGVHLFPCTPEIISFVLGFPKIKILIS